MQQVIANGINTEDTMPLVHCEWTWDIQYVSFILFHVHSLLSWFAKRSLLHWDFASTVELRSRFSPSKVPRWVQAFEEIDGCHSYWVGHRWHGDMQFIKSIMYILYLNLIHMRCTYIHNIYIYIIYTWFICMFLFSINTYTYIYMYRHSIYEILDMYIYIHIIFTLTL